MFAAIHVPDFTTQAIGRHHPELRVRQSAAQEASAHAALLDCAAAFSPRVEDTSADTIVLDIQGLERLFGSAEELARNLSEQISQSGLIACIAIASNPDTAICAARAGQQTIIPPGTEAERLKDLDIANLHLDTETHETLLRWGIRTFGALAKLPAKALSERLGQKGVQLHRLARGRASRPLVPRPESLHFEESMELDDSITTLEPLTFILNRLCDSLFCRLRSRGLGAQEVHLKLQRERPHDPFVLPLRLPIPAQNARIVMRLLMLDLEAHPPGGEVIGVHVEAVPTKPRIVQNGLFLPLSPEPEKLELTLARIANIVGNENVGSPELVDTYARGRFEMKRWSNFGIRISDFGLERHANHLGLRIFRPALEATVQTKGGIPSWIAFSGFHGNIETASGPWNRSGDWWKSETWIREEWDIAVNISPIPKSEFRNPNSLLRIYHDLVTHRWYAEGIYD